VFSKYFQDELNYLRELGREFSNSHPALAPMLADRGADPDVERLLEGVAFLTARIRQKLDDEIPEVIVALSELLFPHLVRPLPVTTILELKPLPSALRERRVVPRGTEFASVPVDGTSCRFRSCADVELAPWSIREVRLERLSGNRQELKITFDLPAGLPLQAIAPERLRLHITGDVRTTYGLLMHIAGHLDGVAVGNDSVLPGDSAEVSLGKNAVELAGYDADESLLPFGRTAFPGLRLLEEYYVLPAKFAFIDVVGIGSAALDEKATSFSLMLRFDAPLTGVPQITTETVRLHCVPVVNLFETTAEPIRLEAGREKFLVRPANLPPGHGEVYAITQVSAITRGKAERQIIPWFFEFIHADARRSDQSFYVTHLEPSVVGSGADVYISFGTAENSGRLPRADLLSIDLIATNASFAQAVRPGELRVPTASSPPFASFTNITATTTHVPPPLGLELQWRAISHAAMNLRSIADPEVLRSVLRVYNLQGLVDRQAARANELRIAAIKDVRVKPIDRLYRGAPVRGISVDLDLEESGFVGDGDLFLFGAVLERLFAAYVPINSFSQTSINGVQSKLRYTWPARSGSTALI
jgi:type VI secretion system protein ImpG